MNKELKFSVVMPVYNMEKTIGESLASVLSQTYDNFEVIIQDNDSSDKTAKVVRSFSDPRIKYFKNDNNVGYLRNLIEGKKNCSGDILFYLAADDILAKNALKETNVAFLKDENIGAVTRPYIWFYKNIDVPVRVTPILNEKEDEIVNINDFSKAAIAMHNEVLGQLSGLAFRLKYLEDSFFTTENQWIAHGYPFINIFKKHPIVMLKNYQIAVRIESSSIRGSSDQSYVFSPTQRWVDMLNEILSEKEYQGFKNYFIKNVIAVNFVGFVQIRSYSRLKFLLREICYLLKYKWSNIFDLKFWFFSLGCIFIPKAVLAKLTDWYKHKINSRMVKGVKFEYDISRNY